MHTTFEECFKAYKKARKEDMVFCNSLLEESGFDTNRELSKSEKNQLENGSAFRKRSDEIEERSLILKGMETILGMTEDESEKIAKEIRKELGYGW